jgi:hypothetical protein
MTHSELLVAIAALVIAAVLVAYLAVVFLRKRQLLARPGGLTMSVKVGSEKWTLGVGRYAHDHLLWYSALHLGRRPTRDFRRATLEVTGQRGRRREEAALPIDIVVVECLADGEKVALAFSAAAVTGFLSWLEASAPRW